jgi:23S rRNA pseudouridine1911/1915/1917 synthase
MRLDQFLADPLGSRARAARLIEHGLVKLDGRSVPKRHLVLPGERVEVAAPDSPAAAAEPVLAPFAVVFEDDHLLIVDKPAGVVVHPARGHRTGTLAQALAFRAAGGEDPGRAGIVHRLDRYTSGLLVVAKSDPVHRALKALISTRALRREYLALVEGVPPARSGTVDAPIGRDRRDRTRMSIETAEPKAARTHFELLASAGEASLLRVVLETGRTHQIRVHLAAIGHPVCGDRQYGGSSRYGLERQFLHAARLVFEHPITGEALDVHSPLPDDLERALELATGDGNPDQLRPAGVDMRR